MIVCDIGRRLTHADMERCENEATYHLMVAEEGEALDLCPEHWLMMKEMLERAGNTYAELPEPSPYRRGWQPLEENEG